MSNRPMKRPNPFEEHKPQEVIEIQKLTTIGTVKADQYGTMAMVTAAFSVAGDYLNGRAGNDGESDAVQFEYNGVMFKASATMPEARSEEIE